MNHLQDNQGLLLGKIDEFTRKYYINQLLRGIIYSIAFVLIFFLVLNLLEYKFYFSTIIRKIFFSGFILGNILILRNWIFLPLLHYYKLGKIISHQQAAEIIGSHFQNVQDKLLNILQLKERATNTNAELINASINQKIKELKPIPFTAAIDLSENKKYLKYALAPFLILVVILFSSPNIIKESTGRIIHSSTEFEKPTPFYFEIQNEKLEVLQYEDYTLEVKVKGEILPNEIFIEQNNYEYKLEKKNVNNFIYKFNKLQKDVQFNLSADGVHSKNYELKVLAKPMIINFDVILNYPKYIGKQDEVLKNIGDLVIPQGTKAGWNFSTQNTKAILVNFDNEQIISAVRNEKDGFNLNKQFLKGNQYTIYVSNESVPNADSISYSVTVIPDLYPTIEATPLTDSINKKAIYFIGDASDDYGIKNVFFKYEIQTDGKDKKEMAAVPISISINSKTNRFNYFWDLGEIKLNPDDKVVYYFEAWDNDGVNGSKFARTPAMIFEMPSEKEFDLQTEKTNEAIKSDLEKSIKEADKLKDEIKELQEKLLEKKTSDWEDKRAVQKLMEKQKQLQNQVENVQDKYKQQLSQQSDYKEVNERILEKQKQLLDIFNSAIPDEMRKKIEELQQMMEKLNKEQTMDELKNAEMSNEQLEKTLDRMLALFQQMVFEQKLQDAIDDLKKLAKEQEELKNKTEESKSTESEKLKEEQKAVNEKFEDIEKKMSELQKIDKELKNQNSFEKTQEKQEQIKQNLENASNNLQQKKNKKASENQGDAAHYMKSLSQEMESMKNQMEAEQLEEDMRAIRQLLENLVKLSFDQEELMNKLKTTNINSPQYLSIMKEQQKIKEDAKMIEDSLFELSKRQASIESFVLNQTTDINKNLDKGIYALEQRVIPQASSHQQYVMTATNNLALMLSEAMKKMQEQQSESKSGLCKKPGKKKSNCSGMSQMQKDLNEQLKKMKEGLKPGEKADKQGQRGMSKELAQMAAQQSAIRQALQKLNQEENKDGKGSLGNLDKLAKEMEQTETELLNKQITEEMMKRQQEILTRLLESAEAERQRETDNKREAQQPKEYVKKSPPSLEEYLKKREAEVELYKTVSPNLKPYYKNLVEQYFKTISF